MHADGSINVLVAFRGKEKQAQTAGLLLPLISDYRLHHISLGLFIPCQDCWRSVFFFQTLSSTIEKFLVRNQIPVGIFILQFNLNQAPFASKVKEGPFKCRLDKPLDGPGISALNILLCGDPSTRLCEHPCNFLLAFGPTKAKRRTNLRILLLADRECEKAARKPQNPDG